MKLNINQIVDRVIKEMKEGTTIISTTTGDSSTASSDQKKQATAASAKGDTVKFKKETDPISEEGGKTLTAKQVMAIAKKAGTIVKDAEADLNQLAVGYNDKVPASRVKEVLAEYDIEAADLKDIKLPKGDGTMSMDQAAERGLLETTNMNEDKKQDDSVSAKVCAAIDEALSALAPLSESEDKKAQKTSANVMTYLNKAKTALEALAAHETKLSEEAEAENKKVEDKHLDAVKKLIKKKRSKDPNLADKLARDYDKVIRKLKDKDPEKVEEAIFAHFLKEAASK